MVSRKLPLDDTRLKKLTQVSLEHETVEIRLKSSSTLRYDVLRRMLHNHLNDEYDTLLTHSEVHDWREVSVLEQNVERVWIGECCKSLVVRVFTFSFGALKRGQADAPVTHICSST